MTSLSSIQTNETNLSKKCHLSFVVSDDASGDTIGLGITLKTFT